MASAVGPGAYDAKVPGALNNAPEFNMDRQRQSSFFSNAQLDRFGRSSLSQFRQEQPSPGPGLGNEGSFFWLVPRSPVPSFSRRFLALRGSWLSPVPGRTLGQVGDGVDEYI